MRRRTRSKPTKGDSAVGRRLEVVCGPIAHGGFTVARADGRVIFVRHSLPGERLIAEITEGSEGDRFWRADAVEVLDPAPGRVPSRCELAGPGGCGGCDFQHVDLATQRDLKAAVVAEQLRRIANLDWEVVVEAAPGDDTGLGYRARVDYVPMGPGEWGLRAHRSHRLVPVEHCPIATTQAQPGQLPDAVYQVRHRTFTYAQDGFWQPHRLAPEVLVTAVLEAAQIRDGDQILDLYSGVGLFAGFLAEAGPSGRVWAVEGDRRAVAYATENLADLPRVEPIAADVAQWLASTEAPARADAVVLDPPRAGAKAKVVAHVCARQPRVIVHVACDPAALARDVALYAEQGYDLETLRAFDLFPMTHHVECVALLSRSGG